MSRQIDFHPIRVLNKRMFRQNKGRNIVAILAVFMTTVMFTTLFTLAQSMNQNMIEMTFRQTGYRAQVSFKDITKEQAELLAAQPEVTELGQSIVLGLAENKKLGGRQVEIRWADESYARNSFGQPTTGSLPAGKNEIALDTITLDRLGIAHRVGEEVVLQWRKDLTKDEITTSVFSLSGFWEGNESSYASMAWISEEFAKEMMNNQTETSRSQGQVLGIRMAQVHLKRDTSIEADMDKILAEAGISGLKYNANLAYSPELSAAAFQESVPMYGGMVLVFLAGFLIIYNIFQISVTTDIQFYGKLKTLGTTTKQIKRLIYGQANRLSIIAVPAGLVFGWLLGSILVPVLLGMLEEQITVSANPVIFIGSALFAWVTVLLSCMRPARLAGKISPVEALRMSDTTVKTKRSRRNLSRRTTVFTMAWANLGRNRKRTVTVICSLSLGLILLSAFYAKNASFDMEKYLEGLTISDFELTDSTDDNYIGGYDPQGKTLNEELVQKIGQLEGLEGLGHVYSKQFNWEPDDQTIENLFAFYTKEMLADWATYEKEGPEKAKAAMQDKKAGATLFGIDGIPLDTITKQEYLLQGSFDRDSFEKGGFVLAVGPAVDSMEGRTALPVPSPGSAISLDGRSYTVMAVVYPLNSVISGAEEEGFSEVYQFRFLMPTAEFQKYYPENTLRKLYFDVRDEALSAVQEFLDEYTKTVDTSLPITSRQTMSEQYKVQTRASAVMGNAISIIIALVGVLNFVNSMVTAIVSRKREFAMIQSIGMTKKQLCLMLVSEGLFYGAITLLVSWILGALTVSIGVRSMVEGGYTTFRFTMAPLWICTPILIIFAVFIPFLCFKNLEKQSIVERLRAEG